MELAFTRQSTVLRVILVNSYNVRGRLSCSLYLSSRHVETVVRVVRLVRLIDREFEFYEFFSFLKFNEFYEFFFG